MFITPWGARIFADGHVEVTYTYHSTRLRGYWADCDIYCGYLLQRMPYIYQICSLLGDCIWLITRRCVIAFFVVCTESNQVTLFSFHVSITPWGARIFADGHVKAYIYVSSRSPARLLSSDIYCGYILQECSRSAYLCQTTACWATAFGYLCRCVITLFVLCFEYSYNHTTVWPGVMRVEWPVRFLIWRHFNTIKPIFKLVCRSNAAVFGSKVKFLCEK